MAIVTFMKNGISDEEMEIAKSELKSIFDEEKNVFTGIVFKWREVRGKEKGETLIAGNPETKEPVHVTTANAPTPTHSIEISSLKISSRLP